jgi:hypothetical protein
MLVMSNRNPGGAVHTYLTISIAECFRLLIGNAWVDWVLVFSVSGARICGLGFLVLGGSLAGAARRIGSCVIAQFTLVGHGIVRVMSPSDFRRVQEFSVGAYSTVVRCHCVSRI